MKECLYGAFLRLPRFKGMGRLTPIIRDTLFRRKPISIIHGLRVLPDPIEWVQSDLLRDRISEPSTTSLYAKLLSQGSTYVDVGAHIGYHTLIARHHIGPGGKVIAIEPQPYNCSKILENWGCNGFDNIVLYPAAAGPEASSVSLTPQNELDRSQLSMLADKVTETSVKLAFRVPVRPLSEIFEENAIQAVELLKIDVEGFETEVLKGLGSSSRAVKNIVLEILKTDALRSSESLPVLEELKRNGFSRWQTVTELVWQPGDPLPENNLWATR